MKKFVAILVIAGLVVGGFALVNAQAARPFPTMVKLHADGGKVANTSGVALGFNYTTGFEPGEGFSPGYIKDQPCVSGLYCWGVTASANRSLVEGHVDTIHPYAGAQHLRLSHDPSTRTNQPGFGLGVDARIPEAADLQVQPVTKNSVSAMVAVDTPFGQDFRFQPQSNSQGYLATSALFFWYGGIYILDDDGTGSAFWPTGVNYDPNGLYKNYTVVMSPCVNTIDYFYDGVQIWSSMAGCFAGSNLEQILIYGDNYPGSSFDVDDVEAITYDPNPDPAVCGDAYIALPCGEQCEAGDNSLCGGRACINCVCDPICTFTNPCPLVMGANGPYITSTGYYTYTATTTHVSINACGSNLGTIDSFVAVYDAGTLVPIIGNDDCNTGTYGANADPTAACYDNTTPYAGGSYEGCVRVPTTVGQNLLIYVPDYNFNMPPAGSSEILNVYCVPECAGKACADPDGCGGFCDVPCDDGFDCTSDVCNPLAGCVYTPHDELCDDGLYCTGVETCVVGTGCVTTPRNCNDGIACTDDSCNEDLNRCEHDPVDSLCDDGLFCNGPEFCDVQLGCQDGPDPCTADQVCDEEKDQCEPGTIPTVSTWGMVILALLLLTGAKVYFGRRQALA